MGMQSNSTLWPSVFSFGLCSFGNVGLTEQSGERQSSGALAKAVELAAAKEATGEYLGLLCCQVKPVQFPGALGLDIPSSPLYTAQIREEHAYRGSQGPLYLFAPCRLELFLACCAKVRTFRTFCGSSCRGGRGGKLHYICMGRANMSLNFSSFPPDSVPRFGFWNIFFGFILYHLKEFLFFQVPLFTKNIGNVKRTFKEVIGAMWACASLGAGELGSSQSGRDGCSSSIATGRFRTFTPSVHSEYFLHWATPGVRRRWCPITVDLHTFMVAVSRFKIHNDGKREHRSGRYDLG